MASSSSQNPSASTPITWDVFLSFCEVDTRYKFTSHLQAALVRHGVRTFGGDPHPDPRSGEVISDSLVQAINESKTFVIVFSKNYAATPRCLDELVRIYHCYETMQKLVIPVYYNIDPSVVQYQTGRYKKAFRKHEVSSKTGWFNKASKEHQTHSAAKMEKVNKWRLALTRVAGFSGETVSAQRSESVVINQVVDRVLLEINPMTLDVAKYPVGLDFRVEDVIALFSSDTTGVMRIGLSGMGGVGKTTLAKAVYNQSYYRFQGSCFLENIREFSRTAKGIVCLQQKLVNDVLKSKKIKIDNVDQGIELIKARICSTKALIVIDDLDDPRPLEFLGPFAPGSIVIITTRNEDVLDSIKVEARYKVSELGGDEARKLLIQHALRDNEISNRFTEFYQEILKCAGGLPLALEVFGSNLCNKSEEQWTGIDKLKRVATDDVIKKLVISFDALKLVDPMLQDIFLDIACFFIGRNEEEVVKIMETCYTFVNRSINILKKRCLLTINDKHELAMYGLVRDMGRQIVCNNSPDEPEKHSRLWVSKDICDILKNHKGTKAIEGIVSSNFNCEDTLVGVSFDTEAFRKMSKLRFLSLKNVNLNGSFEQTFENLRWFCWDYCPLKCLPSDFYPQKLVILELPHSEMRRMWGLKMDSHVFGKLKTLNMSYSLHLITTPDFRKLPSLETINLECCESLEEVHGSIGSLARLVSLNLCNCVSLKSLPDSICNSRALKSLNIGGCKNLKALPMELRNIESLTDFDAMGLTLSNEYHVTPSYSASGSTHTGWDVFLNFYGDDISYEFTSNLYLALDSHGVGTFKDNAEIRRGEVISAALLQAIQESEIYIVVLSENYASSSFCLEELVEILNCNRTMQRLIIPVFYNIDVSVVKFQTGSYRKAFEMHQVHYESQMEKVNTWRLALKAVTYFSGHHISRIESDIIQEIAGNVALQVSTKVLYPEENLFGVNAAVEKLYEKSCIQSNDFRVTGIWGMGGIGKTTTAKAFYNRYLNNFDISCFVENVKQRTKGSSPLLSLLEQLLSELLKRKDYKVPDIESGIRQLKQILSYKRALVVLDDLDQSSYSELFVKIFNLFSDGSRVIVTTRDVNLLNQLRVDISKVSIHKVKELGQEVSLELFSYHAFGITTPPENLRELSVNIVNYVGGLPLALKVLGSSLCGRTDVSFWKAQLEKVRVNPEIIEILKLSYDELGDTEKAIFLDIVFFYIGKDVNQGVRVFKSCGLCPEAGIPILVETCLLTFDQDNRFQMHSLIQEMGKELIFAEAKHGKSKRLHLKGSACLTLQNLEGTDSIEGLILDLTMSKGLVSAKIFERLPNLRLLEIIDAHDIKGNFTNSFHELRCIRWSHCPWTHLPVSFRPQKLVYLDMPFNKLKNPKGIMVGN